MKHLLALGMIFLPQLVSASWAEKISVKGDFRYRHDSSLDDQDQNDLQRYRARLGFKAIVDKDIKAHLQFSSGEGSATSSNQSLGDTDSATDTAGEGGGFGQRGLHISRAYFEAQFDGGFSLTGGKMKNPWKRPGKSSLIWDSDVNPEGINLNGHHKFNFAALGGGLELNYNLGSFWTVSRSASSRDSRLAASQLWTQLALGSNLDLVLGKTYYNYSNLEGQTPISGSTSKGNSFTGGLYDNEYHIDETFIELTYWLKDRSCPITVYYDLVENTEASSDGSGFLYGVSVGKNKQAGDWQLAYNFRELEADAVLDALSDGDPWGGGTDGSSHMFSIKYNLKDAVIARLAQMQGEKGIANPTDYTRTQLDFVFKF